MAIITGGWVIPEIHCEIRGKHSHPDHSDKTNQSDDDWYSQGCPLSQIILIHYIREDKTDQKSGY